MSNVRCNELYEYILTTATYDKVQLLEIYYIDPIYSI